MATQPSTPVLQSDTFEIQRQKINNFAADSGYPSGGTNLAATNGYTKLPSGIILQWGLALQANNVLVNSGNTQWWYGQTIAFPIPFPNACFNITANVDTKWFTDYYAPGGYTPQPTYYTAGYPWVSIAPFVYIDTITTSSFKGISSVGYGHAAIPATAQLGTARYYWSAIGY